ncbi:serine hydrolase [Actinoplanes solisilvae]|uniref:serine hydrolase n=1 Tax=Actinoplanes solisilvae TaxID=2486853 RepID=UPI000FDAEB08|nr:serine hydrolase [Actinoplanes solisilvae]
MKLSVADDRAGLVKVFFHLRAEDGWPPVGTESLWARPVSADVVELDNTPFFARGVSCGDHVRVVPEDDGTLTAVDVVEWSQRCTVRVVPFRAGPLRGDRQRVPDEFATVGVSGEGIEQYSIVALDIPPTANLAAVKRLLRDGVERGWWDYEESNVGEAWADAVQTRAEHRRAVDEESPRSSIDQRNGLQGLDRNSVGRGRAGGYGALMSDARVLLPRVAPAVAGVSSRAVGELLDRLERQELECHSLMVVRRGRVVAEGWWTPFSAGRPHLLYSLTKSFTAVAVGLAIADGVLSLDDRVVDVLPEHVPADVSQQGRRVTVHHLLSMTSGHGTDSLGEAWELEPGDLVKGFLRVPFTEAEGSTHVYDNATTGVLARMVERVTGRGLPELLDERLFGPMGVDHAEWDRVAGGAAFGFHGLHLTTEAVAAFGEVLRREGRWGERQLVPRDWVRLATREHVETRAAEVGGGEADSLRGYGYQFWLSQHGYRGEGNNGQMCVVVPEHGLVVAVTAAVNSTQPVLDAVWECLLPGLGHGDSARDDEALAERLRRLSLAPVRGAAARGRSVEAKLDAAAANSPLADGTRVNVDPVGGGWRLRFGSSFTVEAGHGEWRESSPLGRPIVATGAWQGDTFVADLYVVTTPHRVRLVVDAEARVAVASWNTVPLTTPDLIVHLRSPLMTRPDVA